jgi:HAD superfamily hydrolase (TIGR01509 family)
MGLVERLRRRYSTGVISNTIPGLEARLRDEFDIAKLFDVMVGSGDLGIAKPGAEIYLRASETLGVAPEECIFIDDTAPLAEAAKAVGMSALHFVSYPQLMTDLSSMGVEA